MSDWPQPNPPPYPADDEDEQRKQKAFDRLERASRGPSVVTADEERRLYELSRQGVEAAIQPVARRRHCIDEKRHKPHEWTPGDQSVRYFCEGRR